MKKTILCVLPLLVACGESTRTVTVNLESSSLAMIDPYAAGANLARVRVRIQAEGAETTDEASALLDLATKTATFEGIQDPSTVEVRAEGYDEQGNVVAYGHRLRIEDEGDLNISFPFRRNVAYLTHLPDAAAMNPERQLYVLDVVTRAYLGKVPLPGNGVARQVTARGGDSLLVTYEENGLGKLGILDAGTHEWRSIDLQGVQEVALGVSGSPNGIVAGANHIAFVDLDAGTYTERFRQDFGGRVLDAAMSEDGRYGVVVIDADPSVVIVDARNRSVEPWGGVESAGGVGMGEGRVAYITSRIDNAVKALDVANETSSPYDASAGSNGTAGVAAWAEGLQTMFALRVNEAGIGDVLAMGLERTPGGFALVTETIGQTLVDPVGIVIDGPGRRVLIAAPGGDDAPNTSGLTMVAARPGGLPVSSSILYPSDPDDTYMEQGSEVVLRRRYRPRSAAIVYGR